MTDLKHTGERSVLSPTCVARTMGASGRALTRKRGRLSDKEDRHWGQAALGSVSSLGGAGPWESPLSLSQLVRGGSWLPKMTPSGAHVFVPSPPTLTLGCPCCCLTCRMRRVTLGWFWAWPLRSSGGFRFCISGAPGHYVRSPDLILQGVHVERPCREGGAQRPQRETRLVMPMS